MPRWYVYILRCRNNSLYTGITNNLKARLAKHQAGTGAKYTRSFGPVKLVYTQAMRNATFARQREVSIKSLSKRAKEKLVKDFSLK